MGDTIQCYTNIKGEIVLIYVTKRNVDAEVYFSKNRVKTTTEDGKTTRQPDANGWYVFECAYEGEQVTVKTQSLDTATMMDAQSPQAFALKVNKDGVIQKAYPATAATGGSTRALNAVVKSVDGGKIVVRLTNGDDFEMPMASGYKVFNVSEVYDDHWGEKTTIQVGDTLQSYTNKDNKVCLVYVRTRVDDVALYWNIDKQYDSNNKMSTRTRQADGYFHVMLAVGGSVKEFLVKEQSVINYIDSANGAVACTLRDGVITKAQAAIYGKGIWTSVEAAVVATVKEVKAGALVITDSNGAEREIPLNAACQIYDVSASADPMGKATEPKVGDSGRIYLNMDKEAMYFFISKHNSVPEAKDPVILYWNLHRNTSLVADADGYYHFEMAVGGEIKSFKTKDAEAASYANTANGAVALTLSANDPTEFVKAQSALYADNVDKTGATGKVTEVTETYAVVEGGKVALFSAGVEIYDVSGKGAFVGEATELKVGDTIGRNYVDADGYALYIYITARVVEDEGDDTPVYDNSELAFAEGTTDAECTYCGKVVTWTALETITANFTLENGGHYYLADDITGNTAYYSVNGDELAE